MLLRSQYFSHIHSAFSSFSATTLLSLMLLMLLNLNATPFCTLFSHTCWSLHVIPSLTFTWLKRKSTQNNNKIIQLNKDVIFHSSTLKPFYRNVGIMVQSFSFETRDEQCTSTKGFLFDNLEFTCGHEFSSYSQASSSLQQTSVLLGEKQKARTTASH